MTVMHRTTRAVVGFCSASVTLLLVAAEFAPGWRAAVEQAPLDPGSTPPEPGVSQTPSIDRVAVDVQHADGGSVKAWIVTPTPGTRDGPVPGMVLVPGSGTASRDTLLALAEAMARSGVAAIVYDKRTNGYSFASRNFNLLADDAIDAAVVLAAHARVEPSRVGILGFSEGGWVAPIAVDRSDHVFAFLALVSAPIVTPLEQVVWAADRPISGAPGWLRRIPETALTSGRYFRRWLGTDISDVLDTLTVPLYAVWGCDDTSIPVVVAARTLIREAQVPVTVRLLPGIGHDPAIGAWTVAVTTWIEGLPATARDEITGAEPSSHLGLAALPSPAWYLHPLAHAALALAVALGSGFLPLRQRGRH